MIFFLLILNYQMNKKLIILKNKSTRQEILKRKGCHSSVTLVAPLTICGLAWKTKQFSATCVHTSGILECLTEKKHRDHLLKPSQFQRVIFGLKAGDNLSVVIISICLSLGLGTRLLAFQDLIQVITLLTSFSLLTIYF